MSNQPKDLFTVFELAVRAKRIGEHALIEAVAEELVTMQHGKPTTDYFKLLITMLHLFYTTNHVSVSELAKVTEEAQSFLNHKDNIDNQTKHN